MAQRLLQITLHDEAEYYYQVGSTFATVHILTVQILDPTQWTVLISRQALYHTAKILVASFRLSLSLSNTEPAFRNLVDGDMAEEEEEAELSEKQKIEIAKWFLLNAPPGEIQYVAKGNFASIFTCILVLIFAVRYIGFKWIFVWKLSL